MNHEQKGVLLSDCCLTYGQFVEKNHFNITMGFFFIQLN